MITRSLLTVRSVSIHSSRGFRSPVTLAAFRASPVCSAIEYEAGRMCLLLLGVARFAWDRQPHLRYFFRKTRQSLSRPLGRVSPEGLERRPRQAHEPSDAMNQTQLPLHLPYCTRLKSLSLGLLYSVSGGPRLAALFCRYSLAL